jgi:hypothetical protein
MDWDMSGFPMDGEFSLSEQEGREIKIWEEATQAAIDAACQDWTPEAKAALDEPLSVILTDEDVERLFS